ncbi:MAG: nuclear transport factor 2 family protein [Aureispira sp.]
MELTNKQKAVALIESLETGAHEPISYINPAKYIQHNLGVEDGLEGFGKVVKNAPEGGFKAKVIRAFEDKDFVVLHTEYNFFGPKAGFDIFRFEEGRIVEHWDNLTAITPPNPSGRTQLDGTTTITNIDKTAANKALVQGFVTDVLLHGEADKIATYINPEQYLQHNSGIGDGLDGLGAALLYFAENNLLLQYDKVHQVLGEGNFVLTVSEGKFGAGDPVAYYDLFCVEAGKIVEHWDIIETIPATANWKNQNGKFGF